MTIDAFEVWLDKQGYRRATKKSMLNQVARAERAILHHEVMPHDTVQGARCYLRWAETTGIATTLSQQLRALGIVPAERRARRGGQRKMLAVSYTDDDWRKLSKAVAAGEELEDAVLEVILASGLRIGTILPLSDTRIVSGLGERAMRIETKGGSMLDVPLVDEHVRQSWRKLAARARGWDSIASALARRRGASADAAEAAYQRVNRALKRWHDKLALNGRAHLHRLRRTVAIQALRTTGDIVAVQQLLGHASATTTHRYVDEKRAAEVAALQSQLVQFRK